jgi:long-chain fatty acid transport protein
MKTVSRPITSRSALAVILFSVLNMAHGAGFYLSEIGTPGSLGTAGVANPTNTFGADASWANPAGMTGLQQDTMVGGMQFILPKVEFDSSVATSGGGDGGNAGNPVVIPSFFYVNKLSDNLRFGFSVAGTMGGGVDYGDNFVGRYSTIKAELGALGISPSLGYKVNDRFSVGAGVSIIYTRFDQDIAINQSAVMASDAKLKIEEATDWGYQPFLGMTYQLSDRALLGVVYRAEMDVELEGDVKFKNWQLPPGTPSADTIDIDWDNPQTLDAGFRYQLDDKNTLFLNAGWQEWSAFSTNTLEFSGGAVNPSPTLHRNFDDTWHAGIAFAHNEGNHGTSIGFSYDSSPVDDKDRTFDLPFDEIYKLSMSYVWTGNKQLDFSVGGTVYLMGDAKINQTSIDGTQVIGEFDTNNILFIGGTARYRF